MAQLPRNKTIGGVSVPFDYQIPLPGKPAVEERALNQYPARLPRVGDVLLFNAGAGAFRPFLVTALLSHGRVSGILFFDGDNDAGLPWVQKWMKGRPGNLVPFYYAGKVEFGEEVGQWVWGKATEVEYTDEVILPVNPLIPVGTRVGTRAATSPKDPRASE